MSAVICRDATVVYLEGESDGYERSRDLIDRNKRPSIYASGADWFQWYRDVHDQLREVIDRTNANFVAACEAEQARESA